MKLVATIVALLPPLASGCAHASRVGVVMDSKPSSPASVQDAQAIAITRSGSRPSQKGPAEYFTGTVRVDPLFNANKPSRTSGGLVTFEPGARSAWHTHPLGQTLIVTAGVGRVQSWGAALQEIRTGDVVWTPPGVKHWHGGSPTSAMTHIAIQENLDGKAVDWLEKVSDDQYHARPTTQPATLPAAAATTKQPKIGGCRLSPEDVRRVSPAFEQYTADRLLGEVWKRPGLTSRDRSIVTISALIARSQTAALPDYFNQALDSGVTPSEISEIITHLAFYSGWANAFGAVEAAKDVLSQRGIRPDQLPPARVDLLPLDEAAESRRASQVESTFGSIAPGVVQYTTDVLFRDLWLRPGLTPRDRSLATVSALIASGQVAQVSYHLNRAMDNGLTRAEASEVLTQLAFYAGWPNVFSALPVVKEVFEKRPR